jgi:hypothetical protein
VHGRVDGKDEAEGIERDCDDYGSGRLGRPRPKGVCMRGVGQAGRDGWEANHQAQKSDVGWYTHAQAAGLQHRPRCASRQAALACQPTHLLPA